jgi:translation initiation factor 5B
MNEKGKKIGVIHQIQNEGKNLEVADKGTQVALSIKEPTVGRQINEGDIFYTDLNSREARILLERFADRFNEEEQQVFNFILSKKREVDPAFGYI